MKRILLLLLTVLSLTVEAQLYNNEWIDYNKTYYKFKVGATGLYRISQTALSPIGMGNANADHFQLWRNGQQIPIFTSVQGAALGANDYIEFWGEMNDGKPDLPLYREADYQLNDKFSLQTDTATFFLTINTTANNLRLIPAANNVTGNTLPEEPFFMHTFGQYFKAKVNPGRTEFVGKSATYSSSYDYGEGWSGGDIVAGATFVSNAPNLHQYAGAGAPDPIVKVNAVGNSTNPRQFKVRLNGDSIIGQTMDYFDYVKVSKTISISQVSSGNAFFQVTNLCATPGDRMVITKVEFVYPRKFHFGGTSNFNFELPANAAGNYLVISGFSHSGAAPILYDLTNGKRYEANTSSAGLLKIVLQPSLVDRKLLMVSEAPANIREITSFQQRNFVDYRLAANQGDFLIITHPSMVGPLGGSDPVEEYRAYRSSPQGRSYNAKIYLTDQLEDQFAFGIRKHPLSIRNFLRWARTTYSSPLKSVLLIGKGVLYTQFLTSQNSPDMEKLNLVPTFGNPASDNLLSAEGNSFVPLTPIGRISVINRSELAIYLDKVKQYEQIQTLASPVIADKLWMKNVVHVTGASDNNTSDILLEALNGHKRIIEDTSYAANVSTFTKNSADAVQQVSSVRLENLFREGIGILTYFGHSSASTLEFNLDNPYNYDNAGKYPVFIVMGCNAGSFYNFNEARFSTQETISEKFVLAKDRGSIAFLASTHLGIVHYLDIYNSRNYRAMTSTHYGATLGDIMGETIRQVNVVTPNDFYARFQCEQFTLHGDPALKLYNFEKPDYVIEEQLVKVSPSFITVSDRVFKVDVNFMNIGKSINKNIIVEVKRTFPDRSEAVISRDTVPFTKYLDSLSYTIDIIPTRDQGLNKITVTLDAGNAVDELYETNNSVTKDLYIIEDDVKPVYPYNYSIINQQDIKLVASSADPFAPAHEYRMEMDTTELFNSSSKITRTLNTAGGVFEFTPGITFADSTVYYWRVAAMVTTGAPVWNVSSFQYIANGNPGFSQAHYYQHLKSDKSRIELDEAREWKYIPITNNLFVANGVWGTAITQESQLVVNVNDSSYIRNTCNYGIIFNVFDKNTFVPWKNQVVSATSGLYGSLNPACAASRIHNFEFPNDSAGRNRALQFLRSVIPDGNFVVVRNQVLSKMAQNQYAVDWLKDELKYGAGNSMYTELKNQGFADIDSINQPRAFSFVFKKNGQQLHAPKFTFSNGIFDPITLSVNCITTDSSGVISSPKIGPAKSWDQLHWRGASDLLGGDEPTIDIFGINASGTETLLIPNLSYANQDHDISSIDAKTYPYVILQMKNVDRQHYTPYQLNYWMLTYNPVPEGAIAPNLYFTTKDTVTIGQEFDFGIAFKNVSKIDFDSIKVKLTITDMNNLEKSFISKHKPLVSGDTVKFNVPVDTKTLSGNNTIFVNFNPDNDQPEQYLFNNYAFRKLYVVPDSLNPVMDVTFDGTHILNRDIISAKPRILVKLTDEMKSMILDDTSLVTVSVRYPNTEVRRFYFNSDTLQFVPASQGENTASVNFDPYFPEDGEYELIVTGKDRSGNFAGDVQYKVSFTIINKPMISNMLNYPNPFTTSTAFVFTVTGAEVPQNIRIQVLTITGKIVREITKDELGPLHIGRNITEFKWDGTDQYGQKLANGIYLYRVITNLNGKSLDKYKAKDDNTDKYFNKGYGKMYLMR
jgi:hypothetical protein